MYGFSPNSLDHEKETATPEKQASVKYMVSIPTFMKGPLLKHVAKSGLTVSAFMRMLVFQTLNAEEKKLKENNR